MMPQNSKSGDTRPKYNPLPCSSSDNLDKLHFTLDSRSPDSLNNWIPILTCSADFPLELFEVAMLQLINHPEYNSALILRSETISDRSTSDGLPEDLPILANHRVLRNIHRKLLPRRPGRDPPIEQNCTFYTRTSGSITSTRDEDDAHDDDEKIHVSCVILTPILKPNETMPFYHPTVSHLAFRYITNSSNTDNPRLRVEVVPLPSTSTKPPLTDPTSRIYRTSLALLETVHRYGYGAMTNYQKRMHHDCIVPREEYQDLYLVMRERFKHLVTEWKENTDPAKHVFEDIGIATFLMLLWKQDIITTNSPTEIDHKNFKLEDSPEKLPPSERMPWYDWPRPPGGFLDLGCGNGLLTHILTSCGYLGIGIDLRARTSWSHYPDSTRSRLFVHALDPLSLDNTASNGESDTTPLPDFFKPGAFIIANHADELTPYTPLLATLTSASGYLSIPCCAWSFDQKFQRGNASATSSNNPVPTIIHPGERANEELKIGGGGTNARSGYALYRLWLANLSMWCGWENEFENLRIPSTRNWAVVARKRRYTDKLGREVKPAQDESIENVRQILQWVRDRGIFKTRRPEGKAGDH